MSTDRLAAKDYLSPGFEEVSLSYAFPHMIQADPAGVKWAYMRKEIPHIWYTDRRYPRGGFLNHDEVHILYNSAIQFRGRRALEIGVWKGWSSCHLMLAGVHLDAIDPLLARDEFQADVSEALSRVRADFDAKTDAKLIAGRSPDAVEGLAGQGSSPWSLIFIDGDHTAPAPLADAKVAAKHAASDALILFHDLTSPDVAEGLAYLREKGWNTMVYQTMQIMGAAWRGEVRPVAHIPDPDVDWELPDHLSDYKVSSM